MSGTAGNSGTANFEMVGETTTTTGASDDDDEEGTKRRPIPFPYDESEDMILPEDYVPTKFDVINGRGRKSYNHIANRRFRQLIACNLERYLAARCKVDKTLIVVGIVDTIRNAKPVGGFLKRCTKSARWISMSDESAREKVGHCLRDMIASQRDDKKGGAPGGGSKATSNSGKGGSKKLPGTASQLKSARNNSPPSPPLLSAAKASSSPAGHHHQHHNNNNPPPMMMMNPNTNTNHNTMNPWHPIRVPEGLPAPKPVNPATMMMAAGAGPMMMMGGGPMVGGGDPTFAMWAAMQAAEGRKAAMRGTAVAAIPQPSSPSSMMHQLPPMPPLIGQQQQQQQETTNNAGPSPPPFTATTNLNNLDTVSLQKGNLQDMSEQQRRILKKLENGWKGTVEELLEAVK